MEGYEPKINAIFTFENGSTQRINMSLDAYNYMTSDETPKKVTPSFWKKLDYTKRINHYLDQIRSDLGAVYATFTLYKTK